jgi:hypothetical protein
MVSSSVFLYDSKVKTFFCDISEFYGNDGEIVLSGDRFTGQQDASFVMVSDKTGREVQFTQGRMIHNDEYEIERWVFNIDPEEVEKDPSLQGIRVVMFND